MRKLKRNPQFLPQNCIECDVSENALPGTAWLVQLEEVLLKHRLAEI
jgi:hypothetical protein